MAITLVKEDGSGKVDANVYANVADADEYHAGHLYDDDWTGLDADKKAVALVMATRVIDAEYQFHGIRATISQALQWPRSDCRDPDGGTAGFGAHNAERVAARGVNPDGGDLVRLVNAEWIIPSDLVPKSVVEATCELARELSIVNRTAAPDGEGLKYYNDGSIQKGYDKADKRPIIPALVQAMLAKYGTLIRARSGSVQLTRA
jgi:hypothetical protein